MGFFVSNPLLQLAVMQVIATHSPLLSLGQFHAALLLGFIPGLVTLLVLIYDVGFKMNHFLYQPLFLSVKKLWAPILC